MAQVLLLSRLHHRNLVRLEGFCDESGLQVRINLLVFIQNILCSGCQFSSQRVEDNGKSQIQAYISMIFQAQSTFKLLPGMYAQLSAIT
jgi:hypothetical protein